MKTLVAGFEDWQWRYIPPNNTLHALDPNWMPGLDYTPVSLCGREPSFGVRWRAPLEADMQLCKRCASQVRGLIKARYAI